MPPRRAGFSVRNRFVQLDGGSGIEHQIALADSLTARGVPRCAALITEAADVYQRRGLTAADRRVDATPAP